MSLDIPDDIKRALSRLMGTMNAGDKAFVTRVFHKPTESWVFALCKTEDDPKDATKVNIFPLILVPTQEQWNEYDLPEVA